MTNYQAGHMADRSEATAISLWNLGLLTLRKKLIYIYIYFRLSISDNISDTCAASRNMCLTFLRARRDRKVWRGEPHLCDSYRSKEALPTARGTRVIYIYITVTFKIDLSTLFNQSHLLQVSLRFRLLALLWITWSNVTVLLYILHM